MAGRPQNRLELRRQYEAAEPPDPVEDESADVADLDDEGDEEERRPKKKKAPAKPRATKATKAAKPAARMRIVWTVVNDAFKPVATFEFSKKEEALTKAAEMTAKGKGTHFVQKTKEAMPDDAPGLGAALPRETPPAATPSKTKAAAPAVEEDEEVEEVETEEEADNDDNDDDDDEDDDEDD